MVLARKPAFSIVIPTYTGQEHIDNCFSSILLQKVPTGTFYEVVVVIDGPNSVLQEKVENAQKLFLKKGIVFKMKTFKKNKGRFLARLEGAKLASAETLLFIDDRVTLSKNYLKTFLQLDSDIAMPNVIEVEDKVTPISLTLRLIRKSVYGASWGQDFEDHYIDASNFDRSPKGTTSLWIRKKLFVAACQALAKEVSSSRYVNEDTKILKQAVQGGHKILRTNKAQIFYNPRTDTKKEMKHLYARGPRFVDYYFSPGNRLFVPLLCFYIGLILIPLLLLMLPTTTILLSFGVFVLLLLILAVYLARSTPKQIPLVFTGVILAGTSFATGLVKGLIVKFK